MTLRRRLLLLLLVLLAVGLIVSDVVTLVALRGYLVRRLDDQLAAATPVARERFARGGARAGPGPRGGRAAPAPRRAPAADVRVARFDAGGTLVEELAGPFASGTTPFAAFPPELLARADLGSPERLSATVTGTRYRVLLIAAGRGDVIVAVAPLREVDATVRRVAAIEVAVTLLLLVSAGLASLRLVRVALAPLGHMADTADAIAAGDVGRRVDVAGGGEVERLGDALNNAFDARRASEERLRSFVADASHELRTPLTSIRGYAELLRSGALTEPRRRAESIARIESEAARMGGLVDDLLTLARLDQGRPLRRDPVELTVVAAEAVADARAVEPDRPITLAAPTPVVVAGDEARLRQIVGNLVTNAREHTPVRTPIELRVTASDGWARLDVVDRGPGIAPEHAARVFDRFWRADPAHAHGDGTRGSGLGLAIVAKLAEAHGGRAWVEPSARGAHLVVTLPLTRP